MPGGWNETDTPYERSATLVEVFAERVAETPEATALRSDTRMLSYRELDEATTRLARLISASLDGPDQCVAVLAQRSIEAVVAFLAVLKAGGAYVPIDPSYPLTRIRFMLEDTAARLVLTEPDFADLCADSGIRAIRIELVPSDDTTPSQALPMATPLATGSRGLAYVMYTSGSSGRPKGVAVEHRGILRYARGHREYLPTAADTVLMVSHLGFDASTYEIFAALLNGSTLAIHSGRTDPREVMATIRRHHVTVAFYPTGLLHQMIDSALDSFDGLRLVLAGGDVMSPTSARRLARRHPSCVLINAYGPTETTVSSTAYRVRDPASIDHMVPIGRPFSSATNYVLDETGAPVEQGAVGELHIGGDGVARGYLNLPELTRDRFLPDPFMADPDARMYRTGDRVRLCPDGELEYLGRLDDQVKIRGYRIEPAEIEIALRSHPEVSEAAVIAREDIAGHPRLIAYVASRCDAPTIHNYLRSKLPEYMIPSKIVVLDHIPQTANGKVDRVNLPEPARTSVSREPADVVERSVLEALREVLRVESAGIDDDFFELGGDSLLALQVLARVAAEFGVELSLDAVFDGRTASALAECVRLAQSAFVATGAAEGLPDLPSGPATGAVAASVSQSQVCFLTEFADSALPYQSQSVIHLHGPLDIDALTAALNALVARHEIFRTSFPREDSQWTMKIHPTLRVDVPILDVSGADDPPAALAELIADRVAQRIRIDHAPLVRWQLVRLSDLHHALIQIEHHLVHDGWSYMQMVGEIGELYRTYATGEIDQRPAPSRQYRHFAEWQRSLAGTPAGGRQLDYWQQQLADLPQAPQLPMDRPRPRTQTFRGQHLRAELQPETVDRIHDVCVATGCTPFHVMLTAFYILLHRYSGQTDLIIGSGLANRRAAASQDLLGMLVNTVSLRADLSGDPSVDELLVRVRRMFLAAYANQEIPFEEVVRRIAPERHAGQAPIYQHLFSFHDSPPPNLEFDELTLRPIDTLSNSSAKADLNVVAIHRRGFDRQARDSITVVWEYASDLFDPETAQQMLTRYVHLLEQCVANPQRRLDDLTLAELPAPQREAVPYERESSIPALFAAQVSQTPNAAALISAAGTISYAELDRDASRIAGALQRAGVAPGDLVGVLDERAPATVAALLGILRCGAAYVGLDPNLPLARLRQLLDVGAITVVCASGTSPRRSDTEVIVLDVAQALQHAAEPDPVAVAATDLAYVCFTSGSTGEPKGVEITHRGVLRLVRGADYVRLDPSQRLLAISPLSFDASTFELWGALLNGASVVLAPIGPLSTAELAHQITEHHVTAAFLTAALFHQMVDNQLPTLATLHQLLAGGEVLSPAHVNHYLRALPAGSTFANGYGPTEATTFACSFLLTGADRVDGPVPIGRPIANTWVQVTDEQGRRLPDGLIGELWIGGDGLARGYAGRPDLTSAQFVLDPETAERFYRSGDRARVRHDGVIEFHGRADRQLKLRGFRIEPAEVETVLQSSPGITQAHVTSYEFGRDDRRLVAYLVGPAESRPPDAAIREELAGRLPAYLVPANYIWLDQYPLTTNGKIDESALPAPSSTWFTVSSGGTLLPEDLLPRDIQGASRLETALVAIWQDVLGVRQIGLDDNFFELGGHSLLAVELFAAIERSTRGARLPLAAIFEAPTIRQLGRLLRAEGWDAPWGSLVALNTAGSRPPFFAVTAGDGNVVGFGPLARRLGPDQPFYVLQPHGLDGRALLHRSVTSMAATYVKQIRTVAPHGPYLLGGRCFGTLVAYEMTRLLEQAGQTVAVLAAIDSVGPLWQRRLLANGVVYDEVMNMALVRAGGEADFGAIFTDVTAARRLVEWLAEPIHEHDGCVVDRYLHAAYLARPDLRAAFPLDDGGHAGLRHWGWVGGRYELGMNPALLATPTPEARRAKPSRGPHASTPLARITARAADLADVLTRGAVPALADRRRARLLQIAQQNVQSFRAGAIAAPVVLIRSEDDENDEQLAQLMRWYGLQTGGVQLHHIRGTHHGMLREPDVQSLAECLRECISAALESTSTSTRSA